MFVVKSLMVLVAARSEEEEKVAATELAIREVEAELAALGKKLAPLEEKEELKTLDDDDRIRLAALRRTVEQLRDKEKQLRDEKKQLRETELERLKNENPAQMKELKLDLVPLELKLQEQGLHMVAPLEVRLPTVGKGAPAFCAEVGWLERITSVVEKGLASADSVDDTDRVAPLALIRCSRGGKTRALYELAKSLRHASPDVAVVYVSFNDYSGVRDWERENPVCALCCRIAFAALFSAESAAEPNKGLYDRFANTSVTADVVRNWLSDKPCLLLIDELNVLEMRKEKARELAEFLKANFLITTGRFFVFSSHFLPPPGTGLAFFMDHASERPLVVEMLPLLGPPISDAQEKLKWGTLTVREALYRGRVPALIYCTRPGTLQNFAKREAAIDAVKLKWDDRSVIDLLRSFLSGRPKDVFVELWPFMNTGSHHIFWIFLHMDEVLDGCWRAANMSEHVRGVVALIRKLLSDFEQGKTGGGDSWEALFVVALLIRIVCRQEDELLCFSTSVLAKCTMSYNELWEPIADGKEVLFENVESLEDFEMRTTVPKTFPHVAVYYPRHARFPVYDVIMAVYDEHKSRRLVGYQLKEGKKIPEKRGNLCEVSVLIRGAPARKKNELRNWKIASESQIDSFLGESGKTLAPKEWRKMGSGEGEQPVEKKSATKKPAVKKPTKKKAKKTAK